jgi:hypothetical protein
LPFIPSAEIAGSFEVFEVFEVLAVSYTLKHFISEVG